MCSHDETTSDMEDTSSSQIAPTFLLFLDCVFQLIQQYPEEFEFNEVYLIHTWDHACSAMSYTYSFDGIFSFLNYLNNQTFMTDNSYTDTSVVGLQFDGIQLPKFNNTFLDEVFKMNSRFWLGHLEANADLLLNSNFNIKNTASILTPNPQIYALKFWSRCYLRWYENLHAYTTIELDQFIKKKHMDRVSDVSKNDNTQVKRLPSTGLTHTRPAPPPPIMKYTAENVMSIELDRQESVASRTFITDSGIKVTTRTTQEGDIESSF